MKPLRPSARPCLSRWALASAAGLVATFPQNASAQSLLTYTLPSPLKVGNCVNDGDDDCLDDATEDMLASAVAPMLFFDEDEHCASGSLREVSHHQVRPRPLTIQGLNLSPGTVWEWDPADSRPKSVVVSFYFNWPVDCGNSFEGSHLGDSEHIRIHLVGTDLSTWSITMVEYASHGNVYRRDGVELAAHAADIGADRITVAVEEDKHGSWWGRQPSSQDCAGSEDEWKDILGSQVGSWGDVLGIVGLFTNTNLLARVAAAVLGIEGIPTLGNIDCFPDADWNDAFNNGTFRVLDAVRNIGEPPLPNSSGRFHTGPFPAGGALVASLVHPGAFVSESPTGAGQEYWWGAPRRLERFCGYLCPAADRESDGSCAKQPVQLNNGTLERYGACADGLESKVDQYPFVKMPPCGTPQDEVCDLLDNDCDGLIDEGFVDIDGDGEVCADDDIDGDGHANEDDNCPGVANDSQADHDGDGLGDACDRCIDDANNDDDDDGRCANDDNCPAVWNRGQRDADADGSGDACDLDDDNDGIDDIHDLCPYLDTGEAEGSQANQDGDTAGDPCDNCPTLASDDFRDVDLDGLGNPCDDDDDGDGVLDVDDNCPNTPNPAEPPGSAQADSDGNGIGDACERFTRLSPLMDTRLSAVASVFDAYGMTGPLSGYADLLDCPGGCQGPYETEFERTFTRTMTHVELESLDGTYTMQDVYDLMLSEGTGTRSEVDAYFEHRRP